MGITDTTKILVTGGAGYVGSNLIKTLLDTDPDIRIISFDNYSTGLRSNHIDNPKITYLEGDCKDLRSMRILRDVKTVFHFGEYSRITTSFEDIKTVADSNMQGTFNVLEFCRENKCNLIYSASSSKFGDGNENLSPYAWMKSKNVELIKNYNTWFDLQYDIAYFYNVYGKNHIKTGKYATVIGIFENAVENNEPIPIIGDGDQERDFTHVDDITLGLYKIYKKSLRNKEYFLGTGENHTILKVALMFSNNIKHLPKKVGERKSSIIPSNKNNQKIGWKSQIKLKE